jgi:hypothetical protein
VLKTGYGFRDKINSSSALKWVRLRLVIALTPTSLTAFGGQNSLWERDQEKIIGNPYNKLAMIIWSP